MMEIYTLDRSINPEIVSLSLRNFAFEASYSVKTVQGILHLRSQNFPKNKHFANIINE